MLKIITHIEFNQIEIVSLYKINQPSPSGLDQRQRGVFHSICPDDYIYTNVNEPWSRRRGSREPSNYAPS